MIPAVALPVWLRQPTPQRRHWLVGVAEMRVLPRAGFGLFLLPWIQAVVVAVVRLPPSCVLTTFWRWPVEAGVAEAQATEGIPPAREETAWRTEALPLLRPGRRALSRGTRTTRVAVLVAVAMPLAVQVEH